MPPAMLPTPPTTPFPASTGKHPNAPVLVPALPPASAFQTPPATAHVPHAAPALPIFGAMTPKPRAKRRGDAGTTYRALSDNELSYYLPSRGDGVNDMYVHHGVRARPAQLSRARVRIAWALQLVRHPLLAATISMRGYDDVAFVHSAPTSVEDALAAADARMQYFGPGGATSVNGSMPPPATTPATATLDIVDAYLNGPRTLGNDMLACLVVRAGTRRETEQFGACGPERVPESQSSAAPKANSNPNTTGTLPSTTLPNPNSVSSDELELFEVMLCTTHYVGDGMALHTFMNELYTLLGSGRSDVELMVLLESEVDAKAGPALPPSLEERLGLTPFQAVVGDVAQRTADTALLGGQVLPFRKGQARHTVVPTYAFTPAQTKTALAKCKAHGVTIAHVVFGLCAVAWNNPCADRTQPTMIYSALNMRPHMAPAPASFFHLAVGYFNIVLPSLAPLPETDLVWLRAAQTKAQTQTAVRSPLAKAMFRATASARAARSQHWAAIDDAAAAHDAKANPGLGLGIQLPQREAPQPDPVDMAADAPKKHMRAPRPAPAGKALMGVSMLGNLDGMYRHADHGGIEMYALTTGSRQRAGALLLFAYTLAGKLWLSLGYDQNGFESGAIERFWQDVLVLAREVLLS